MKGRMQLKKENKQLKTLVVVLAVLIPIVYVVTATVMDERIKSAYEFGYKRGFDGCIEENNLYERYADYGRQSEN